MISNWKKTLWSLWFFKGISVSPYLKVCLIFVFRWAVFRPEVRPRQENRNGGCETTVTLAQHNKTVHHPPLATPQKEPPRPAVSAGVVAVHAHGKSVLSVTSQANAGPTLVQPRASVGDHLISEQTLNIGPVLFKVVSLADPDGRPLLWRYNSSTLVNTKHL